MKNVCQANSVLGGMLGSRFLRDREPGCVTSGDVGWREWQYAYCVGGHEAVIGVAGTVG